ncbi:alpha/beta hydrolase [Ornithinimicrobium panacihumi]|uniref:alpha/beta hydrolase n=1 Tax=Ornithinimicrobium panacihumi TaxID=2008449 RepID=UPI003F89E051
MSWTPGPLDHVINLAVRGVGLLPPAVRARLAGEPRTVAGQRLDPDVQLILKALGSSDTFESKPLAKGRDELDAEAYHFGSRPRCAVSDLAIPTREGAVLARHYRRTPEPEGRGLVLYLHGGGWVLGGLQSADSVCRVIARHTGLDVVQVDYRLAPEHPFPAAVEDSIDAFRWLRDHAERFGGPPGRVAVAGESAGGNLAAVVAQETKHDPEGGPQFSCPIFPVTDLSKKAQSYRDFSTGFFLTEAQTDWYKERYLPTPEDALDPRVSPLLAKDLSSTCPTCVVLAGCDPLRDEGRAYAARLAEAGVPTEVLEFEGFIHAFINGTALGRPVVERVAQIADRILAGMS